jgi:hypothetical protein
LAENSGKPKKLRADPNDYDGGSSSSSMFEEVSQYFMLLY